MQFNNKIDLVVIGGGASGFMGAIKASEDGVESVVLLEGTAKVLEKVRISGGGRCNVTNACWVPTELVENYPRGKIQLKSSFSRFAAGDTVSWFSDKGLELVIEDDGRMFPKSNSSQDVIKCLKETADKAGVICLNKKAVSEIEYLGEIGFLLHCKDGSSFPSRKIL